MPSSRPQGIRYAHDAHTHTHTGKHLLQKQQKRNLSPSLSWAQSINHRPYPTPRKQNIVKISVSAQIDLQTQCNQKQNPSEFVDSGKLILKFIWTGKNSRIAHTILEMDRQLALPTLIQSHNSADNVTFAKEEADTGAQQKSQK